jgi:transposase
MNSLDEHDSPCAEMDHAIYLSNVEWALLEPLPPKSQKNARVNDRKIMNAVFYELCTGPPRRDLPARYGPYTTAYNRFNRWSRRGTWKRVLTIWH